MILKMDFGKKTTQKFSELYSKREFLLNDRTCRFARFRDITRYSIATYLQFRLFGSLICTDQQSSCHWETLQDSKCKDNGRDLILGHFH